VGAIAARIIVRTVWRGHCAPVRRDWSTRRICGRPHRGGTPL